jgi:dynein heavy chain 1
MIPFINELKSEALKDRHWKDMIKILDLTMTWHNMSDITLRDIWDQIDNFKTHEQLLREIMINAQGEKALEEFLKQISEQWKVYQLELIDYQKKCKVIKSWDDLFTKAKENLSNILSMKLSPYFKVRRKIFYYLICFVCKVIRSRNTFLGR